MDKKCVRKFGSLMKGKTDFGEGSAYHFSTVILRNNLSEFVKNIQVVMLSYMASGVDPFTIIFQATCYFCCWCSSI